MTEGILSAALKSADAAGVTKILRIRLEIGELSDLKAEWIQHYFDHLSKGTIAEGATIDVTPIPIEFTCGECRTAFPLDLKKVVRVACPECGSADCALTGGSGFTVKEMEAY